MAFNESMEKLKPCPLVEVPEPHGRLIDADAMIDVWKGCSFKGDITVLVKTEPTIIPASEVEYDSP